MNPFVLDQKWGAMILVLVAVEKNINRAMEKRLDIEMYVITNFDDIQI